MSALNVLVKSWHNILSVINPSASPKYLVGTSGGVGHLWLTEHPLVIVGDTQAALWDS